MLRDLLETLLKSIKFFYEKWRSYKIAKFTPIIGNLVVKNLNVNAE